MLYLWLFHIHLQKMAESLITIKQALKLTLTNSKIQRLEANILLAHVINQSKEYLITHDNEILTMQQILEYNKLCEKAEQDYPIAYILGNQEFYGLEFKVTENVLIPRQDTELLVDFAIKHAPINASILDMGTGSGAIAVALKYNRQDINMYACDISQNALDIAKINAENNKVKINFLYSDWFDNLLNENTNIKFDMIITNPPYIHKDDRHLTQEIRFEPRIALTDEKDGLKHIRNIIQNAKNFLNLESYLAIEHGYNQSEDVQDIFLEHGYSNIEHIIDLGGYVRVTYARITAL